MSVSPTPAELWRVLPLTPDTRNFLVSRYGREINKLTEDAFGDETCLPLDKLNAALDESNFMGILVLKGVLIGFVLAYIPVTTFKGKHFIWLNKLMVAADYQGQHYGSIRTMVDTFRLNLSSLNFGFIGARTQSPGLLRSFVSLSPVNYPFTKRYSEPSDDDGVKLLIYCLLFIPQLRAVYNPDAPFIVPLGLFIGAYQRKLGLGRPENGSPEVEMFLEDTIFERSRGDALIVVSQTEMQQISR